MKIINIYICENIYVSIKCLITFNLNSEKILYIKLNR